jgi:inward rectifier potassium channel
MASRLPPSASLNATRTPGAKPFRSIDAQGRATIRRIGARPGGINDLYHTLIRMKWRWLFLLVVATYTLTNTVFALLYLALGHAIENARAGSFADCFFFSVQTMATIGYGKMTPATEAANVLVTIEALLGMLGVAMATGLIFAKFARSTARVMFSRVAVVSLRDGQAAVMFRVANERATQIVEAYLTVAVLFDEFTKEGERLRRFTELQLQRAHSPVFALSWTVIHYIDDKSPLFGKSIADLEKLNLELVASLVGMEEITGQQVHARHSYHWTDLRWNHRLVDVIAVHEDGTRSIDYRRFHEVEETPGALERVTGSNHPEAA